MLTALKAAIAFLSNGFRLKPQEENLTKISDLLVFCLWAIGPPLWFLFEYAWVYSTKNYKINQSYFDDFKYTQGLAANVWIAVFVVNAFILFIKYGKKIG